MSTSPQTKMAITRFQPVTVSAVAVTAAPMVGEQRNQHCIEADLSGGGDAEHDRSRPLVAGHGQDRSDRSCGQWRSARSGGFRTRAAPDVKSCPNSDSTVPASTNSGSPISSADNADHQAVVVTMACRAARSPRACRAAIFGAKMSDRGQRERDQVCQPRRHCIDATDLVSASMPSINRSLRLSSIRTTAMKRKARAARCHSCV